jgi:hypothetical protein
VLGKTLDELEVGDVFPPIRYTLTALMCAEYAHAMEDPLECYYSGASYYDRQVRPPTMVHVDKLRLLEEACTEENWLGESEFRQARIHVEYSAVYHSPAFVGEELVVTGRVAKRYVRRGRDYLVCEIWTETADGRKVASYTDRVALSYQKETEEEATCA